MAIGARGSNNIQKYLPNAAAARKELLDQSKALEAELALSGKYSTSVKTKAEKWAQICKYYQIALLSCLHVQSQSSWPRHSFSVTNWNILERHLEKRI